MSLSTCRLAAAFTFALAAGWATAAPVVLTQPAFSTSIANITATESGEVCIVGSTTPTDTELESRGLIIMFSRKTNRVLWQHAVRAPDGWATNSFKVCRIDGDSVYVGAEVDTDTHRASAQALVYLYRFDRAGKQLGVAPIAIKARNAYLFDLDVSGSKVSLVGMTMTPNGEKDERAMLFATLDRNLKGLAVRTLNNGAFQPGSAAMLSEDTVYIAGQFAPSSIARDVPLKDDYAVSKIVGGKYHYSTRPMELGMDQPATAFGVDGEVISLASSRTGTHLRVVSGAGRVTQRADFNSIYSATHAMTATESALYAVRSPCKDGQPDRLVEISRVDGAEFEVKGITGRPRHALAVDGKLIVVSSRRDGSLRLDTLPQITPPFREALEVHRQSGSVTRSLALSKWDVDSRGVPSFDYRFTQRGANCDYQKAGRAIAGFDESGQGVELEVFNPQNDDGSQAPSILLLRDHEVELIVPTEHAKELSVTYTDPALTKLGKACAVGLSDGALTFRK